MRIIAGKYRGRVLRSPPDLKTRPTSDRLRETLFNIVAPRIDGETRFLDLCAGTGAIGIEAVSRGAAFVTFVDKSRKCCGLVEANLDLLDVPEDKTEVVLNDATEFLRRARKQESGWDLIYFDPPYSDDYKTVFREIAAPNSPILSPGGLFIAEHHHKTEMFDLIGELRRWRLVKQGDSCLSFYEKN